MTRVHLLIVEDQESDADLIVAELRRAGLDPVWRRVTSEAEYVALLDGTADWPTPDVILADFNLPQFTGIRALQLLRARGYDIPFILVSGTIGEDVAVESIKLGATDYLLKDRLARLGPAIRQALAQKQLREAQRQAEAALREADRRAIVEYGKLLERLNGLAQRVGTAPDTTTVFRALRDFAVESVPINGFFVSLYDPATQLRTAVYATSEGEEIDVSDLPALGFTGSPQSRAVETGDVVLENDYQTAMRGKPRVDLGLDRDPRLPQSSLAVPFVVMGRVIGALEVQSVEPAAYTTEHVTAMRMASNLAAIAVQNVQLLEQERQLARAVEQSPSIVVVTDTNEDVVYVNPKFVQATGYAADEVVGTNARELGEPLEPAEQAALLRALQSGDTWHGEFRATKKDGGFYWELASVSGIRGPDGTISRYIKVAEDITDRKQAEADLLQRNRHQEALSTVVIAASGTDDVDAILAVALAQTLKALTCDAGAVWLGSRFETHGISAEVAGAVDRATREAGLERSLGDLVAADWQTVDERDAAGVFAPIAVQAGIRATLAVPIRSGDQRVGALAVLSADPHDWTAEEIALVKSIARELGTATERRWAQQRILQQLESLSTLYSSAKKLSESLDFAALTNYVVRTAVESFGVRAAAIRRASPDGAFTLLATYPPGARHHRQIELRWDEGPGSQGPGAQALRTGLPSVLDDVSAAKEIPADRLVTLQRDGIRSTVSLPLIARDKPFGVLSLYSEEAGFFRPARVEHFQAFANLVAAALENARLFDDARRRLEQLQAMRDIDTAISGSLDARVTMNIFLDKVTTRLGVDAADILLLNPTTQMLEYLADRGFRTATARQTRLRLDVGLAGQAALERRAVSILNLAGAGDRLVRPALLTDEGFVAYVGVPLVAKGQIRGVLEVFHRRPLRPDPEWMDFLSTLAGQAAIALESATMFDNLQRANTDMTLAYDTTLEGWSRALDLRDKETEGHTQRVTELTVRLAGMMGMSDDELVHVRRGALLHDIGKMGIPDSILLKPGPLTDSEWEIMRRHPVYAHDLLTPISYLRPALTIPYAHHEKWDGTGYPRGLKGEAIKLEARVFAVVDAWDALTSDRPYRRAWSKEKARAFIQEQSGEHFDPAVVEVFLRLNL